MKTRVLGLIVGFLASNALSATESGTQLEWSVTSALGHTDNATRVDTDPISDTTGSVGGTINLAREGSRVNATLRANGDYLSYFDDTYDNEFLGSAAATIRVGLVGDALTWSLDNTFGQTTTNEIAASTPDNRGNVNVVSTGPDLRLPIGSATDLLVRGRYENSSYQDATNVDSHTWTGGAAVVRRVSPAVTWSFNADTSHVVYTDSSYNEQEVFAQLQATGARQTLTVDLGVNFLDQGGQTDQTSLVRVNWTRRLTPSWTLALDAGSEYLNAAEQFAAGVSGVPDGTALGGTQDVILTDQAKREDSAGLSLAFEGPRTTLYVSSDASRERIPDSDSTDPDSASLDRDTWSVGAGASRRLTQSLQAFIETSYEKRDFRGSNEDDKTSTVTTGLDWQLGRVLFLGVEGGMERRSGNTGFGYDETVYQASLSYRPSGR